jgi:hypothetical protein
MRHWHVALQPHTPLPTLLNNEHEVLAVIKATEKTSEVILFFIVSSDYSNLPTKLQRIIEFTK